MPSDQESSGLESALDELFGSAPADFVTSRKRLARALRSGGDPAAARALEAARRPTRSAWAINDLVRRRPELLGELLDRSAVLRTAQNRAIAGAPGSQRDATRAQRLALTEAADAAVAILGANGEAARAEILSTLQAAAADDELGATLRTGRLERTAVVATGFGLDPGDGAAVVPADELAARRSRREDRAAATVVEPEAGGVDHDRQAKAAARGGQRERDRSRERQRAEARQQAAEELERAEATLLDAKVAAEAARADVVDAEARVANLRAEVEAARLDLRAAKDRVAASAREVSRRTRDVVRRRAGLDQP